MAGVRAKWRTIPSLSEEYEEIKELGRGSYGEFGKMNDGGKEERKKGSVLCCCVVAVIMCAALCV